MNNLGRIGLTATLLAALATGVTAVPASADQLPGMPPCSTGDLVGRYTDGGGVAELDLYWDGANQTNCAEMVHQGAAWGQATYTEVEIGTCVTDTNGQPCRVIALAPPYFGNDQGNYAYHAGPASSVGAGHCILAEGRISWGGNTYVIDSAPNSEGTHC